MRRNFLTFGEADKARKTLAYGILSAFGILVLVFILPKQLPSSTLPVAYTVAFRTLAKVFRMDKSALQALGFHMQSNWRVAGLSVLWLTISALVISAAVVTLIAIGLPVA